MKFIYIAKKDCRYYWSTAASTYDECLKLFYENVSKNKQKDCVICLIELTDKEHYIIV